MQSADNTAEVDMGKRFSRAAVGLAKAFRTTIIVGGTGAAYAPTNESAWVAAGTGVVVDMFRLVRDRGETLASDLGIKTKSQEWGSDYDFEGYGKRYLEKKQKQEDDLIDKRMSGL